MDYNPSPAAIPWLPLTLEFLKGRLDRLQTAESRGDLGGLRLDAAVPLGVPVGKVVHGREGDVVAVRLVDSEDIDGLSLEGELPAGAALQ